MGELTPALAEITGDWPLPASGFFGLSTVPNGTRTGTDGTKAARVPGPSACSQRSGV